MTQARTCQECSTPLPIGVPAWMCPTCLLSQAGGSESKHIVDSQPTPTSRNQCFGDYELLEEIARGGMGVVYRARQLSLNRIVAVKMILFGRFGNDVTLERFRAEARAAASLQHPHIVPVHEVGEHEGQPYYSMDYVEGQNLGEVILDLRASPLDWKRMASWMRTIAEAVEFAHSKGILHRDLKPSNILMGSDGRPRVTDFGLAKQMPGAATDSTPSELTLSGQALGSPNYMPPEQASTKRGKVGPASDVYSLGAILFHLLTGRPPFLAETATETLAEVVKLEAPSPRLLNPAVPIDLATICLKCLEKEPSKRYHSAQELAEELGRFISGETIRARPVSPAEKAWRWCKRKPALAASFSVILTLLVVVLIGSPVAILRIERERKRAEEESLAARKNLYAADISLASQALERGNLGRAVDLLEKYRPAPEGAQGPDPRGWEWRYLWSQTRSDELFTLGTNDHIVEGMVFDTNTEHLVTSDAKGIIKVWDVPSRRVVRELRHPGFDTRIALSPDGRRLISGGYGGTVCIWDLPSGQTVAIMTNRLLIQSVAFSPDGLLVAARESPRIAVWDALTGAEVFLQDEPMQYYGVAPCGIAFSPSGQLLAYGKLDGSITVLDLKTQSEMMTLPGDGHNVTVVAFSPDGQRLAAGNDFSAAHVWELSSRRKLAALGRFSQPAQVPVYGLAFSPDGSRLILTQSNHLLVLYDTSTWKELSSFKGHRGEVLDVAFLRDGRHLISSAKETTLKVWDMQQPSPVQFLPETRVKSYQTTPDGSILLQERLSDQPKVSRFSLLNPGMLADAERLVGVFTNLDGSSFPNASGPIALRFGDDRIRLWNPAAGRQMSELFSDDCSGIDLAPDGRILLLARTNRVSGQRLPLEVWDLSLTNRIGILAAGTNMVDSVAFTPDSHRMILGYGLGSQIGTAEVWDLVSMTRLATLGSSRADRVSAILSRDGKTAYTCEMNSSASIWEVETGRELAKLAGEVNASFTLALSPDETRLAIGGTEILIWDIKARPPQHLLTLRNQHWLGQLAFTPDGSMLLGSASDGLHIWRAPHSSNPDGESRR